MHTRNKILLTAAALTCLPMATAQAGSLETQNNPVANGAITVAPLDPDRSDWAAINPYQTDVDAVTPVLSIESMSVAHDDNSFYFRMLMDSFDPLDPQQSYFGGHHAMFIDTDQDRSTGYIGDDGDPLSTLGYLAIGADYWIEGTALYKFGNLSNPGGADQEAFTWATVIPWGFLNYDDSPPSDIEIEIPKTNLGNTTAFDYIAYTTLETYETQDTYANAAFDPEGDYFTYDINYVAPELDGDLDLDGFVGITDLNIVLSAWNQNVTANDPPDPSGDGFVGIEDLNVVLGNWNAGTPPASVVPEPATLALLGLSGVALMRRRA